MSKLLAKLKPSSPETSTGLYFEPRILLFADLPGDAFGDVNRDDDFRGYQNIELPFVGPGQGPIQFLLNDSEPEISRKATPAQKLRNATVIGIVDSKVEEI